MKKIKYVSIIVSLIIATTIFSGCSQQLLAQNQIEHKLLEIIPDATISEINFVQETEKTGYYEGNMVNSYAEYYFKLDAYTGKTLDWKRTIKYISKEDLIAQLSEKYEDSTVEDISLVVKENGDRIYEGVIANDISYYSFKINAFDTTDIIEWEDITSEYINERNPGSDENNVEFCGEYTVRMKLKNIFDLVYLNTCELNKDDNDKYIYSGQFATETEVYLFTANAYTGEIIQYTPKNQQ